MMAHVDVEIVEILEHSLVAVLDRRGQLGEEQGGNGGVLVSSVGAFQVTVRFLESEQEPSGPGLVDSSGNPFETNRQVVLGADSRAVGQGTGHLARYERCDQIVVRASFPLAWYCSITKAESNTPIWLPSRVVQAPRGSRVTGTPTPMRSASGSLARTKSAPIFLASPIAASSVRGYSGLET